MIELQTWFKLHNIVVNAEKTLAIPFHTFQNKKSVLPHVILEWRHVSYNIQTEFLGIYINENMKWIGHIKYLRSKLSTSYYMNNSLKNVMSSYILRTKYFACFHVHLRYGLTVGWWSWKYKDIITYITCPVLCSALQRTGHVILTPLHAHFNTCPHHIRIH